MNTELCSPLIFAMFVFLHKASLKMPNLLSLTGSDLIKFEDGLGRTFDLPYQWFHTWRVGYKF